MEAKYSFKNLDAYKEAKNLADSNDRINMCMLAFPDALISDIEIARGGKSYTYDTLCEIKELYPDYELYFIIGSDMLLSFDRWYKHEEILDMVSLLLGDVIFVRMLNGHRGVSP